MDRVKPLDSISRGPLYPLVPFLSETGVSGPFQFHFSVRRRLAHLEFEFVLNAPEAEAFQALVIPELKELPSRRRRDELWRHTCLELFVGVEGEASYLEVNLSPSGDWNVYAFDDYRNGMRTHPKARVNLLSFDRSRDFKSLEWKARLLGASGVAFHELFGTATPDCPLVLGATAVLEYTSGAREYWALKHAGEEPDFHLRESFQIRL